MNMERKLKANSWILLALVSFISAWSNQSLWIDECCMVMSAVQDSLADVWTKVTDIGGSDTQMPCYLYLLHIWIKLTGAETEILLRLYNVIWVILAAYFFRKNLKLLLVLIASPFFFYYANELRPYIMQIAASCGVALFLYKRSLGEEQNFVYGFGLLFLLCLTSLTSVIWALGFLVAWIVLEGRVFWSKKLVKALLCWGIPFIVLGGFYLYTLLLGARATHIRSNGLVNVAASVYELFGLTGLGPGRSELRVCTKFDDVLGFGGLLLPLFAGLIIGCVVLRGFYIWRKQSTHGLYIALLFMLGIPLLVFLFSSTMMDFRFSGRHFAPFLPFLCIAVSLSLTWCKKKPWQSALSVLFVLLWIISDVCIRFDDTYAREDYRGAIEYSNARKACGENVLLLCNGAGKEYYDWQDDYTPDNWEKCRTIVVSRPDDFAKIIKQVEQSGSYSKKKLCPSFWVYTKRYE